ncbi:MAG: SurA N-terminal domain-containing protein [Desulfobacteraceae bacterium]|nr:SurA N-terminal domain-containing protein [Desulfobacteraceae bacterium]
MKIFPMILLSLFLFLIPFVASGSESPAQPINSSSGKNEHKNVSSLVVANVNGTNLTLTEMMRAVREIALTNYGKQELTPALAARIKREALERMILEELAFQRAQHLGIIVSPEEVTGQIATMRKEMGEKHYQMYLEREDLTDESLLEKNIMRFLMVKKALAADLPPIRIGEDEVEKAYQTSKEQFIQPEKVQVTDVIFFLDPAAPPSLRSVEQARRVMLGGGIEKLTQDGTFVVRTDIPLDPKRNSILYAAAKKLKKNEISEPTIADGTFHLIQLTGYSPRTEKTKDEVRNFLHTKLVNDMRSKQMEDWKKNLRKDAKVNIFDAKIK